jgi:hypothetical protein
MEMTPRASIELPPMLKRKVGFHELIILPSKLLEDEHPGDRLPIDVAPNVQWPQVLARLFRLLEHDLLRAETHMSDLLLHASKLDRQHEHHADVHASRWRRPFLDQRSLIIIQQLHVVIGGCGCMGVDILLHPLFPFRRDLWPNGVEVLISLLLSRFFPHLLRPHLLDPRPLAGREAWRTPMR